MVHFQREKGRVLQVARQQTISTLHFYVGSYCPTGSSLAVCSGNKVLKFFRCAGLKGVPVSLAKREASAHCQDHDNGTLLVFERGDDKEL